VLQALLQGKISREHEQIEDILTSNVFGLLQYCDPKVVLEFLAGATLPDGQRVFESWGVGADQLSIYQWTFWPYWSEQDCNPCEPDVVLTVKSATGESILIVVEAKLNSGKSSLADESEMPCDQLAREWDNLRSRARAQNGRPLLVYLTSHFSIPRDEVEESIREFYKKRGSQPTIAWLSWRAILPILRRGPQNAITRDLGKLLERMDLTQFEGFHRIPSSPIEWRFLWDWHVGNSRFLWRFV
jgi:hypothetical protein